MSHDSLHKSNEVPRMHVRKKQTLMPLSASSLARTYKTCNFSGANTIQPGSNSLPLSGSRRPFAMNERVKNVEPAGARFAPLIEKNVFLMIVKRQ